MYNLTFVYFKNFVLLYFWIPDSGYPNSGFRFQYCLRLDIALWRKKAPLYVQIELYWDESLQFISNCARSLVLWFEHSGMTEMLPYAWDTRGEHNALTLTQMSALRR